MDNGLRQIVQHLLRPTDTCLHAVQGKLLGVSDLALRLYAVVKHETREEYALFIFSVDHLEQPPSCSVEAIYPIRGQFTAHTQVIKDGWSQVLVATGDGSTLLLGLPASQYPQVFIAQLKKATQLFSQSESRDSVSAFDWLLGYEACHTGWDRFSKPGQPPSGSTNPFIDFTEGSTGDEDPLQAAFPEKWPWSHIITPNSDGSTDIATCEHFSIDDVSEFDPLCVKNGTEEKEVVGITITPHSPSPATDHSPSPTPNPFVPLSTNPFATSLEPHPPTGNPLSPRRRVGIRPCISESNLPGLETETSRHTHLRGEPLITRSTEDLLSIDETGRHCVAGSDESSGFKTGSASSLSDVGPENGELQENGESSTPESRPRKGGRRRRGKEERRTVSENKKKAEGNEVIETTGRRRLNHSPDLRDLRKPRDAVKMRFKRPSGSQAGVSKINMNQPELSRSRAETRAASSGHWVSRYRPGVPVAMSNARESFVQAELRQNERGFCDKKTLRVFCGSWNVNGKGPSSTLDQFLLEYEAQNDGKVPQKPDIYAIGFQELDLSAQALIGAESGREEAWLKAVEDTLRKAGNYHKLLHLRLVGIMLLVYITQPLMASVSDKDVEYVTTGIGGVLGNKGGVGARFNLFHSSFCFVNCHFAASMEEVDRRNQDYHTIRNKMVFDKCQDYKYTIMEHDIVLWLGDMNYRIQTNAEMTGEMIKAHADNYQISTLLREDQLVQEMTKGTIFSDFTEGAIDFKPTYKYDPNTDNWDTSDKHRAPAWCDRVLYHGMGAELRAYRSHPKMKISDHKPVSAIFDCDVRVVDPVREKNVLEEITRRLDKMENDTLPQVDLSQTEFVFTNVKFQVPQCHTLTVTNAGGRPVLVSFIPKLDEDSYSKPWITAKPSSAVLQPLQDVSLALTVLVDSDTVYSLSSGQSLMDDILVLHLEGGKDFFISVTGNYLPSCFGSSLETLVHLHTYIREVSTHNLIDLSFNSSWDQCSLSKPAPPSSSSSSSSRDPSPSSRHTIPPHDIPKELFQLVTSLDTHALKQENLFREGGLEVEMMQIRDALDVGGCRELPGSTHSVANCLLVFLSALSEPVIPVPLHQRAVDCCHQPMLCKQLLLNLPRVHQRTFTYIISFVKRLLSHSEWNGLDAKLLATIFGDILLRTPARERRMLSRKQLGPLSRKKATFVYQFLVTDLTADYR